MGYRARQETNGRVMIVRATQPLRLGIVAGETSGDQLGGGLMRSLTTLFAAEGRSVEFIGIGGDEMAAAGLESLASFTSLSVNGFVEPLRKLPLLLRTLRRVVDECISRRVDAFIGVDFNVFNLLIERRLRKNGVPTVHYVSPSVYAWRRGRTRSLTRSTDLLLTLYPFEPAFYRDLPIQAVCVGHPLAQSIGPAAGSAQARLDARTELEIGNDARLIALLPGSRQSEIRLMAPVFIAAARILQRDLGATFLIPCVRKELEPLLRSMLDANHDVAIRLLVGNARKVLAACDGALVKSGTGTLEAMCIGRPMVVSYKLGPWSYQLARRLIKTPFVALPNILAGRALVPEFLQDDATPANLAAALIREMQTAIDDPEYLQRFRMLRESLAVGGGADMEAGRAVHRFLAQGGV
jgi:lipid-A-disaccharide synthase